MADEAVDVLVVGAGPTGLALAAHLAAQGVRPRVIDRGLDRVHESRALAIQPRTLEVLAGLGVTQSLIAAGNRAVDLVLHAHGRTASAPLFDLGSSDTAYPYLLFLSQAETERLLLEHLGAAGIAVERGVELVQLTQDAAEVVATLRHREGGEERVRATYAVGCDGAHSTVRSQAGIGFEGSAYPQTFVLADVEAAGLRPGAAHAYLAEDGMLFFFPLGAPATWRVLAMRSPDDPTPADAPVTLGEAQALADRYSDRTVRLHDPVWMTNFRLHHRAASAYRDGRVFLAGDAAHIHSPAGAQGMNTGIQDAVNLAWKLAHTLHGTSGTDLLDTYQKERAPVGSMVLRFTDRAYTIATSTNPVIRFARTRVAPMLIPVILRPRTARRAAFRMISQLGIRYRRSPLSAEGPNAPRRGPRAGDRLPDGPFVYNGQSTTLHAVTDAPGWHLLLCGPAWSDRTVAAAGPVTVHRLGEDGSVLRRLGLRPHESAQFLVRPDGHVGYRAGGADLAGLHAYLHRWLPPKLEE